MSLAASLTIVEQVQMKPASVKIEKYKVKNGILGLTCKALKNEDRNGSE